MKHGKHRKAFTIELRLFSYGTSSNMLFLLVRDSSVIAHLSKLIQLRRDYFGRRRLLCGRGRGLSGISLSLLEKSSITCFYHSKQTRCFNIGRYVEAFITDFALVWFIASVRFVCASPKLIHQTNASLNMQGKYPGILVSKSWI
jgi:hypothetical protein